MNAQGQSAFVIVRRPPSVPSNEHRLWHADGTQRVEQDARTQTRAHTRAGGLFCAPAVHLLSHRLPANQCCPLPDAIPPSSARERSSTLLTSRSAHDSHTEIQTAHAVEFNRCAAVRPHSFKDLFDCPLQHGCFLVCHN